MFSRLWYLTLYVCMLAIWFALLMQISLCFPFLEIYRNAVAAKHRIDWVFEQDWRQAWREFRAWLSQNRK